MSQQRAVDYNQIEHDILQAMGRPSKWWFIGLGAAILAFSGLLLFWGRMIMVGMGEAGKSNPMGWSFFITNFVFWVGIAHSGTLISAVLFLFRARFRNRFNRAAEAMTIFAVMTAGLFPLIHLGRVWLAYFLFPYPHQRLIWPNFKSPLVWDVFAISTYFTVSAIFFYVGLVPDFAVARRHSNGIRKWAYRVLSLGWNGSSNQWKHYGKLYALLAAFATPLVISVHSVVSWDFAMSVIPGWHTTIFAPYFVAGAILSGTAMVITLMVPIRKFLKLEHILTIKHFESLAQLLLLTSLIVTYAYIVEWCTAFYSQVNFEKYHFMYRLAGDYWWCYLLMVWGNCLLPLTIFVKKLRTNLVWLFILSIFVNIGMWMERFVIIVVSLARDYLPYAWSVYKYRPTPTDIAITIGSFGLFFTLFLLFIKTLPLLAITEIKEEG